MRDDWPAGNLALSAVWFACLPDRKGIHPQSYLAKVDVQANAYTGFNALYEGDSIDEADVWRTRIAGSTTCTWRGLRS